MEPVYKVVVTKYGPNEEYEQQLNDYNEYTKTTGGKYNFVDTTASVPFPSKMIELRELSVELSLEEYRAVKKSILATFE